MSDQPPRVLRIVVPLVAPITHGDEVLTELELTEPDLGDMMKLDEATGDMTETLYTICACAKLPPSVIKQLKLRDVKTIGEAAAKMLGEASLATGGRQRRGSPISLAGRRAS